MSRPSLLLCSAVLLLLSSGSEADGNSSVDASALSSCWSDDAAACESAVSAILEGDAAPVRLASFASLEALEDRKAEGEGEARAKGSEGQLARLLRGRALDVSLGDAARLRVRMAPGRADALELELEEMEGLLDGDGEEASRSKRTQRVLVPLVVGFALTGLLIAAITAVKLLLLKALLVSKVALMAALWVVARRLLSAIGAHHHPYLYSHQKLAPVHHGYDAAGYSAAASDLGYAYAGYYGAGPAYPSAPADYAHYGHYAHDAGIGVGGDDLQGHYSNQVAAVQQVPPPPSSPPPQRNATRQLTHQQPHQQQPAARTDGMRHAVYGLVKSSANRVPVNTYRKLVTTGRNLQA